MMGHVSAVQKSDTVPKRSVTSLKMSMVLTARLRLCECSADEEPCLELLDLDLELDFPDFLLDLAR